MQFIYYINFPKLILTLCRSKATLETLPDNNNEDADKVGYIPNAKPQFSDKPFEKGMGIDFYFDGCKMLPDKVTVVKASIQIIDIDFNFVRPVESNAPILDSHSYNPVFDWKMEIRPSNLIPTALAFITLTTIDQVTTQVKTIGYSAINLFINRSTQKQPTGNSDTVPLTFYLA